MPWMKALSGFGNHIEVTLNKDNSVTVVDSGRGCQWGCMLPAFLQ